MKTTTGRRTTLRRLAAGKFVGRAERSGRFLTTLGQVRPHRELNRIAPHDIVWPGGEGTETATIRGSPSRIGDVLRRKANEQAARDVVSVADDGVSSAIVLGSPGHTVACLVADEEQAPGVVAVIADIAADPDLVIRTVGKALGRGFQIRRHAA